MKEEGGGRGGGRGGGLMRRGERGCLREGGVPGNQSFQRVLELSRFLQSHGPHLNVLNEKRGERKKEREKKKKERKEKKRKKKKRKKKKKKKKTKQRKKKKERKTNRLTSELRDGRNLSIFVYCLVFGLSLLNLSFRDFTLFFEEGKRFNN